MGEQMPDIFVATRMLQIAVHLIKIEINLLSELSI